MARWWRGGRGPEGQHAATDQCRHSLGYRSRDSFSCHRPRGWRSGGVSTPQKKGDRRADEDEAGARRGARGESRGGGARGGGASGRAAGAGRGQPCCGARGSGTLIATDDLPRDGAKPAPNSFNAPPLLTRPPTLCDRRRSSSRKTSTTTMSRPRLRSTSMRNGWA